MRKLNHDPRAITRHREDAGLTKTALAKELGCVLSLVSEIEGGTRNARWALLGRMAEIFDCPIDDLVAQDEPRRETEASADVDVPEPAMRGGERADAGCVLEVRDR